MIVKDTIKKSHFRNVHQKGNQHITNLSKNRHPQSRETNKKIIIAVKCTKNRI